MTVTLFERANSFDLTILELFAISFVSNATPFFGAPYTLLSTSFLIAVGPSAFNFVVVVVVTAIGASVAKTVIYGGGAGFRRRLEKNRNVRLIGEWLGKRSFYVSLFIAAAFPILPLDDYIYIGAGANKGRLTPMIAVTFLAKIVKGTFEIYLELKGILLVSHYTEIIGVSPLELSVLASIFFVLLGFAIYSVDWSRVLPTKGS